MIVSERHSHGRTGRHTQVSGRPAAIRSIINCPIRRPARSEIINVADITYLGPELHVIARNNPIVAVKYPGRSIPNTERVRRGGGFAVRYLARQITKPRARVN